MSQETIISEEMEKSVGSVVNVTVMKIDNRAVHEYLTATKDANKLWHDNEYAIKHGLGGVIVPPPFLLTMQMEGGSPTGHMPSQDHLDGAVDGGGEWKFVRPIRVEDLIIVVRRHVEISEKKGRLGAMILNTFENIYYNQKSEIVGKARWTTIRYSTNS